MDRDEARFPKKLLHDWKHQHEAFIEDGEDTPALPSVQMESQQGLTLPQQGNITLTGSDFTKYRECRLNIHNPATKPLFLLKSRIQFPEGVVRHEVIERPIGATVECMPDRMVMIGHATGSGSISITGGPRPAHEYRVEIDTLPPGERLKVKFITTSSESDFTPASSQRGQEHHIIGSFQYDLFGERQERQFFVALQYDTDTRATTSTEPQDLEVAKTTYRIIDRQTW